MKSRSLEIIKLHIRCSELSINFTIMLDFMQIFSEKMKFIIIISTRMSNFVISTIRF